MGLRCRSNWVLWEIHVVAVAAVFALSFRAVSVRLAQPTKLTCWLPVTRQLYAEFSRYVADIEDFAGSHGMLMIQVDVLMISMIYMEFLWLTLISLAQVDVLMISMIHECDLLISRSPND